MEEQRKTVIEPIFGKIGEKIIEKTVYISLDGKEWDNKSECLIRDNKIQREEEKQKLLQGIVIKEEQWRVTGDIDYVDTWYLFPSPGRFLDYVAHLESRKYYQRTALSDANKVIERCRFPQWIGIGWEPNSDLSTLVFVPLDKVKEEVGTFFQVFDKGE